MSYLGRDRKLISIDVTQRRPRKIELVRLLIARCGGSEALVAKYGNPNQVATAIIRMAESEGISVDRRTVKNELYCGRTTCGDPVRASLGEQCVPDSKMSDDWQRAGDDQTCEDGTRDEYECDRGGKEEQPARTEAYDCSSQSAILVRGEGVRATVLVSPKTLMLYEITNSGMGGGLEMGDFLDICVEDFFISRGQDIGIIQDRSDRGETRGD